MLLTTEGFIEKLKGEGVKTLTWRNYYDNDEGRMDSIVYGYQDHIVEDYDFDAENQLWELQYLAFPEISYDNYGEFVLDLEAGIVTKTKELFMPEPVLEEESIEPIVVSLTDLL